MFPRRRRQYRMLSDDDLCVHVLNVFDHRTVSTSSKDIGRARLYLTSEPLYKSFSTLRFHVGHLVTYTSTLATLVSEFSDKLTGNLVKSGAGMLAAYVCDC